MEKTTEQTSQSHQAGRQQTAIDYTSHEKYKNTERKVVSALVHVLERHNFWHPDPMEYCHNAALTKTVSSGSGISLQQDSFNAK
jgi:hypothetical protein